MLYRMYIGSFLIIAARYLLVAVAPLVFIHRGVSAPKAGILVGLAFLMQLLASPALGKLADKRGRKTALIFGAVMMLLGGLVIFVYPHILGFIVGQILFGLGPAAFFGAAFAFVADVAPAEKRGSAIAKFGILINVAEAIAPPLGLWLGYSRPWGFGWAAALSSLAIPLFASIRNPQTSPFTSQGQAIGDEHVIPRSWWLPLYITTFIATSYGVMNAYLPQTAAHSHANAGWFFLANFGIQIVLRLVGNKTLDRWNRQVLLALGAGLMGIATILIAYFAGNTALLVLGIVYGVGNFYMTPSLVTWLITLSEPRKGSSMAAYNAAFGAGTALGALVLGPLFAVLNLSSVTFWVAGLLSVLGVTSLLAKRKTGIQV